MIKKITFLGRNGVDLIACNADFAIVGLNTHSKEFGDVYQILITETEKDENGNYKPSPNEYVCIRHFPRFHAAVESLLNFMNDNNFRGLEQF